MTEKILHRFRNTIVEQTNLFLIYILNQNVEYSWWKGSNSFANLLFSNLWIVTTQTKWVGTTHFTVDVTSGVLNLDYKLTDEKIFNYLLS